jgi:hypothetical protein
MNIMQSELRVIKIVVLLTALLFCIEFNILGQENSLSLDDIPAERVKLKEAFNGTHIIYSQSTNMLERNRLGMIIGHRFGKINEGAFNAYGLDQGFMRIGFEYGINDWLTAGIGRSSLGKNFDAYLKHRPLVQTTSGATNIPVSLTLLFSSAFSSNELRRQNEIHGSNQFINQLVYTFQPAISRQFSSRFSAQITGSMVHKNSVSSSEYDNNAYGVGAGVRLKVSEHIHLVSEYNYMFSKPNGVFNPVAIGIDMVAGGHLFNVHVANSAGIIEKEFLTTTTDSYSHGGMRIGFTIKRSFMLKPAVAGGKIKY